MNPVQHGELIIKQARAFFDSWLDRFPAWLDFVQAVENNSLPEFGASWESAIKQITDWLGGVAEAGVLDAELSVMDLSDYDMLCCMIDENATQQGSTPRIVLENVSAAIDVAEELLTSTKNVHEFNVELHKSNGIGELLQNSQCPTKDNVNSWRDNEYKKAKLAIAPGGAGLGRGFIQHFLPDKSIQNPNPNYSQKRAILA